MENEYGNQLAYFILDFSPVIQKYGGEYGFKQQVS